MIFVALRSYIRAMEPEKTSARIRLDDISPRSWEHPADRAALNALKRLPGMDEVLKFFVGGTGEKSIRLLFMASSVRATPRQFAHVYRLTEEAVSILDAPDMPDVFITQNPALNAGAVGVKKPFITLNSAMVQNFSEEELLAVIGHELSHILSGHVLYKTLLWFLVNASLVIAKLPIGQIAAMGIIAALREWDRKSELSADRAGLLTVQDPDVSNRVLMKLAGGTQIEHMDIDEFVKQAEEYDSGENMVDGVYKFMNLVWQTHPFPVMRLAALKTWVDEDHYGKILGGDYIRRSAEEEADMKKDFEDAAHEYQEEFRRSKDPLAQTISRATEQAEEVRKKAEEFFGQMFKR